MLTLPPQPTPFVGRAAELGELARLLTEPGCRLLSLLGPGGVGKTRLAIQAAAELAAHFPHGVCFVPLQAVSTTDAMLAAIAGALRLSLSSALDPLLQILNRLHDRSLLLVLDNFEHLLRLASARPGRGAEATLLLSDLLAAAPGVKLLVTSREVLKLQEEWLFPVQGLPYPADETPGPADGAVALFLERARRVRRDFSPAVEWAGIVRICRLVEGMPLALELAAAWTRTLSCTAIAEEIERGLDFLATNLRNVPERHRSMQTVFEQSWRLLDPPEREALKRLSVFRSSFGRRAAGQVTGAPLALLESLVDKSLLRPEPDGRYEMHELLRQFALEKLQAAPEEAALALDAHCDYYLDFLARCRAAIDGDRQRQTVDDIHAELDNIRAAWARAVDQLRLDALQEAAYTWLDFFELQGRFREGADTFERLASALGAAPPGRQRDLLLAEALAYVGQENLRLGQLETSRAALEQSRALYVRLDAAPPPGMGTEPLFVLSVLAQVEGRLDDAVRLAEDTRRLSELRGDRHNLCMALYALSGASLAMGQYEAGRRQAGQALAIAQALHCHWFAAYCLIELGNAARAQGDYAQAKAYYQASQNIRAEMAEPEGIAVALRQRGRVAILQEDYAEAQRLFEESLDRYRSIGDRGGLAAALEGLGHAAIGLENHAAARQHFAQALRLLTEAGLTSYTLSTLVGVAELMLKTGQPRLSAALLALVVHHPAGDRETKERAGRRLDRLPGRESIETPGPSLDALVTAALAEMATQTESARAGPESVLADALTARELEILRLIAGGLSNPEIAARLIMSVGTIKWYTGQIYGKLGVRGRTQAIARARDLKLLS